eukprot:g6171.t1
MTARCGAEGPPAPPVTLRAIFQASLPKLPDARAPNHSDPPLLYRAPAMPPPASDATGGGGGGGSSSASKLLKGIYGPDENGGGLGEGEIELFSSLAEQLSGAHAVFLCEAQAADGSNAGLGLEDGLPGDGDE